MFWYFISSFFQGGYGTPSSGYGQAYARGDYFDSTVADLQEQINQLVASNEALTNQVYYGSGVATNSVGSSVSSNLLSSSWRGSDSWPLRQKKRQKEDQQRLT